jgi:thiamine biosynthesis lipoprotein
MIETEGLATLDTLQTFAGQAMASPLRLLLVRQPGDDDGRPAWDAVVAEVEAAEQAMSRFRATSDVTRLNQAGPDGLAVDRRLAHALVAADRARRVTAGRFDARVLRDLERLGDHGTPLHGPPEPTATSAIRHTRVGRAGMAAVADPVDLGGIGKGLALRWAADRLTALGVRRFLLDAGGDVVARGSAEDDGPWRLGVEDPHGGDEPLAVVALADGAVTTSSVRKRRWRVDGRWVHHLIDPRTGEPANGGLSAVTVAATDPAWAEVWSKALFFGGRRRIGSEARARGLAAWWVTDDGRMEMTPAARQRTLWVADES